MKPLKFLKTANKRMSEKEQMEFSKKIKSRSTSDLIILATLLNHLDGIRFKMKEYLTIAELDERGIF